MTQCKWHVTEFHCASGLGQLSQVILVIIGQTPSLIDSPSLSQPLFLSGILDSHYLLCHFSTSASQCVWKWLKWPGLVLGHLGPCLAGRSVLAGHKAGFSMANSRADQAIYTISSVSLPKERAPPLSWPKLLWSGHQGWCCHTVGSFPLLSVTLGYQSFGISIVWDINPSLNLAQCQRTKHLPI